MAVFQDCLCTGRSCRERNDWNAAEDEDETWYDAREDSEDLDDDVDPRRADAAREAGVPEEHVNAVASISQALGYAVGQKEPLCDPITLLRFYLARAQSVQAATAMHRAAMVWRSDYQVGKVMLHHGAGEQYDESGSPSHNRNVKHWEWQRVSVSQEADMALRYCFFGRLRQPDPQGGGPIIVWKVGKADVAALDRRSILQAFKRALVSHLEDAFQAARAASFREKRLVNARVVIDVEGVSLSVLKYAWVVQKMVGFSVKYYPELLWSVTIVRAPAFFSFFWSAISPFLDPAMKRKFSVLGRNFEAGLRKHSGLDADMLPAFLGGRASDSEVCATEPVPKGLEMPGVDWKWIDEDE